MLDRKQEPFDLKTFKTFLKKEAVWLGYLGHHFWAVERIFATNQQRPVNEELCRKFQKFANDPSSATAFKVERLPSWATCYDYKYDPVLQKWTQVKTFESIYDQEFDSRIELCKKAIKECRTREKLSLVTEFLARQLRFHQCDQTHARSLSNEQSIKSLIQQLADHLKTFNDLINGFNAADVISGEVAAILESNQQLTAEVCDKVVLAIFVGRYIISDQVKLLPVVDQYIDKIAEICFNMHLLFHAPLTQQAQQIQRMLQESKASLVQPAQPAQQVQQGSASANISSAPVSKMFRKPLTKDAEPGMIVMEVTPEEQAEILAKRKSHKVPLTGTEHKNFMEDRAKLTPSALTSAPR